MLITRQTDYVGGVAQLGERHVRNVEATGSNPVISTNRFIERFSSYRFSNQTSKNLRVRRSYFRFLVISEVSHLPEIVTIYRNLSYQVYLNWFILEKRHKEYKHEPK